jgi:hypothetical protein
MKKNLLDDSLITNKKPDIGNNDSHKVVDIQFKKSNRTINKQNYVKNRESILKYKNDRKKELKTLRLALNKELEKLLNQLSTKSLVSHKAVIKNTKFIFKYEIMPIKNKEKDIINLLTDR